jgi:hypothetical protein
LVRSEHTWWISMYRWRCTGRRGYIICDWLGQRAYMVDIHVQVVWWRCTGRGGYITVS